MLLARWALCNQLITISCRELPTEIRHFPVPGCLSRPVAAPSRPCVWAAIRLDGDQRRIRRIGVVSVAISIAVTAAVGALLCHLVEHNAPDRSFGLSEPFSCALQLRSFGLAGRDDEECAFGILGQPHGIG